MMSARGPQTDTEPKGTRTRRRHLLLIVAVVAASAGMLSLALWTDNALFLGAGAGMGAWLGVHYGNKKAREVDAYRREWLGKRARGANRRGLDARGDTAAGRAETDKNTDENNSSKG